MKYLVYYPKADDTRDIICYAPSKYMAVLVCRLIISDITDKWHVQQQQNHSAQYFIKREHDNGLYDTLAYVCYTKID